MLCPARPTVGCQRAGVATAQRLSGSLETSNTAELKRSGFHLDPAFVPFMSCWSFLVPELCTEELTWWQSHPCAPTSTRTLFRQGSTTQNIQWKCYFDVHQTSYVEETSSGRLRSSFCYFCWLLMTYCTSHNWGLRVGRYCWGAIEVAALQSEV